MTASIHNTCWKFCLSSCSIRITEYSNFILTLPPLYQNTDEDLHASYAFALETIAAAGNMFPAMLHRVCCTAESFPSTVYVRFGLSPLPRPPPPPSPSFVATTERCKADAVAWSPSISLVFFVALPTASFAFPPFSATQSLPRSGPPGDSPALPAIRHPRRRCACSGGWWRPKPTFERERSLRPARSARGVVPAPCPLCSALRSILPSLDVCMCVRAECGWLIALKWADQNPGGDSSQNVSRHVQRLLSDVGKLPTEHTCCVRSFVSPPPFLQALQFGKVACPHCPKRLTQRCELRV